MAHVKTQVLWECECFFRILILFNSIIEDASVFKSRCFHKFICGHLFFVYAALPFKVLAVFYKDRCGLVGSAGLEPARSYEQQIFLPSTAFAAPPT